MYRATVKSGQFVCGYIGTYKIGPNLFIRGVKQRER